MRTIYRIAALMLCAYSTASIAGQAGEPQYFIEGLSCVGEPYGLKLPATLPELLAMSSVQSEQELQVEQWDGYTATRKTIRFKGLVVGLVTYSNDSKRYSLTSVEIRSSSWASLSPFRVGQSTAEVRQKLGGAGEDDSNLRSVYAGENESVHFETRASHVTAVIYECYTG